MEGGNATHQIKIQKHSFFGNEVERKAGGCIQQETVYDLWLKVTKCVLKDCDVRFIYFSNVFVEAGQ